MTGEGFVAGVDGCPGGWLAVFVPVEGPGPAPGSVTAHPEAARVALFSRFADILQCGEAPAVIAVDIPIGLPERATAGGRACDVAARTVLGGRQSAVFAIPSRAAVMCTDYRDACAAALASSDPPRKVSKQAFNLFPKIREVDALVSPARADVIVECHPEVAFWALNGCRALETPKKVKSRPNPDGLAQRRQLLQSAGFGADFVAGHPFRARDAGPDDLVDACAIAWSAVRLLRGEAVTFPQASQVAFDARGLPMRICG